MNGGTRARLRQLLEPVVAAAGYDLEDLTVTPAGRRSVLRVVVDRDGGVDLDRVAELSRALSAVLDRAGDLVTGAFVLEVTSPGVDRPLTEPRHWRRARGRLVRVGVAGGGELRGRVTSADELAVCFDVDGVVRTVPYPELGRGRVQVEFR